MIKLKYGFITGYEIHYKALKEVSSKPSREGMDLELFIQKPIEINDLVKQVKSELGLMRYYLITATIVLSTSWFNRPLRIVFAIS